MDNDTLYEIFLSLVPYNPVQSIIYYLKERRANCNGYRHSYRPARVLILYDSVCASPYANALSKSMYPSLLPKLDRLCSLALIKQPVKEKEN